MGFEIGQMVIHPIFGAGKVIKIKVRGNNLPNLVTVEFGQTTIAVDEEGKRTVIPPAERIFLDTTEKLKEQK